MMKYSINPSKHEVVKARQQVENAVQRWQHSVEVGNVNISLGWQYFERPVSFTTWSNNLHLVLNLDDEFNIEEELDNMVLRGLLEIEFIQSTEFEEIEFDWQELLKFAYVKMREKQLRGAEITENDEIRKRWNKIRDELVTDNEGFNEFFYNNAGVLGGMLGKKLAENYELSDIPKLKRSDLIEAGDELFK